MSAYGQKTNIIEQDEKSRFIFGVGGNIILDDE